MFFDFCIILCIEVNHFRNDVNNSAGKYKVRIYFISGFISTQSPPLKWYPKTLIIGRLTLKTDRYNEQRKEKRMSCNWPIWFYDDSDTRIIQGQLVDISSKAATFTYYTYEKLLFPNQRIIAHFSAPVYGLSDSFAIRDFIRSGHILNIYQISDLLYRITTEFEEVLSFKPGEQFSEEDEFLSLLNSLSEFKK